MAGSGDSVRARSSASVVARSSDTARWQAHARVFKWGPEKTEQARMILGRAPVYADFLRLGIMPDDTAEVRGNLVTTAGWNRITNLIIGGGGQAFTNTRGVVGVGSDATAETVGDTALGGDGLSSTAWYQSPDAGNPSQLDNVITCNATFGGDDGNFAWNEWVWGVATAAVVAGNTFATVSTSGILINRRVQSLGTKASGATWTLQSTIDFT